MHGASSPPVWPVTRNPLQSLRDAIEVHDDDTVTIYGVRYSGDLFRGLGFEVPSNVWFRILKRDPDGAVTIQQCPAPASPSAPT